MISNNLQKKIIEAMKAGDKVRVSTLKLLSSEIKNARIDNSDLSEEDEIKIAKKEAKKRKDAIEAFEKGGRPELVKLEKKELEVLSEYLPDELSDNELNKIIDSVISETGGATISDMGKVMSLVISRVAGRADGKRISVVVRSKLS